MELSQVVWHWMEKMKIFVTDIVYDNTNPYPIPLVRVSAKGSSACVIKVQTSDGQRALKISTRMDKRKPLMSRMTVKCAKTAIRRESISMRIGPHANILRVERKRILPGTYLILMPWVDKTLEVILNESNISPDQACKLMRGINSGLRYIHDEGGFHLDCHEGNILVSGKGQDQILFCDFGQSLFKEWSNWTSYHMRSAANFEFENHFITYRKIGHATKYDAEKCHTSESFFSHDLNTLEQSRAKFTEEKDMSVCDTRTYITLLHDTIDASIDHLLIA
jgi:serine/threonine protein kinase